MIRLALAMALAQAGFHAFIAALPVAMLAAGQTDGVIGVVVGAASVFTILAALASGGLIDRYGGRRVFLGGCGLLLAGALPMATGVVGAGSPIVMLLAVRMLQGAGMATILPSVMSLVPGLVSAARLPTAIAFVGVAANVSLALVPLLSLVVLERYGLAAVALATCVSIALGALLLAPLRAADRTARAVTPGKDPRTFRPAWRPSWAAPLAISFLFVAHWGVVTAYLPQRAELAGADIGLFFTGDALALLAFRVPAGWLSGRIGPLPLVLAGVVVTAASLVLLIPPPTTMLLVIAGLGTGAGGALTLPVIMIELSHRSDATDRGSAFGLYSVAFGTGIAVGSIGIAPVYDAVGFETAIAIGIGCCLSSGVIALADRAMRHRPLSLPEPALPEPARAGQPAD